MIFEAQTQFYREIKKNFLKKSQNFYDFLTLKYNNFRTVRPIRMIFCKLLPVSFPYQLKKEKFKFSKVYISTKKPQNWKHCKIGSINLKMIVKFGVSPPKLGKYDTFWALTFFFCWPVLSSKEVYCFFNIPQERLAVGH